MAVQNAKFGVLPAILKFNKRGMMTNIVCRNFLSVKEPIVVEAEPGGLTAAVDNSPAPTQESVPDFSRQLSPLTTDSSVTPVPLPDVGAPLKPLENEESFPPLVTPPGFVVSSKIIKANGHGFIDRDIDRKETLFTQVICPTIVAFLWSNQSLILFFVSTLLFPPSPFFLGGGIFSLECS